LKEGVGDPGEETEVWRMEKGDQSSDTHECGGEEESRRM
jgi:hypothetical protein